MLQRRGLALFAAGLGIPTPGQLAAATVPGTRQAGYEPCDLRRFGAVGDGRTHPLRERYRSLAEARRIYPRAETLHQEIDACALQAAIDAAEEAGGGDVRTGSGVFILDRTVYFPEARQGQGQGPVGGVSLSGAGQGATLFRALTDFPGFMLDCRNRFNTRWGSQGAWRDFSLLGPGKDAGWGRFPSELGGLGWAARRSVSRVSVQDCGVGISITGDQGMIDRFYSLSCGYGIYFDKPNPILFGDHLFEKVILDGSRRAAIGVHPDASVPKSLWHSPVMAGSPFGIYKEMGGETDFALRSVGMVHAQFENIGLAAISGGSAGAIQGFKRPNIQNLRLTMPQIGPWDDDRLIPDWKRAAMFDLHQSHQGFMIDGINEPNLWEPGDVAAIRLDVAGAIYVSGDIDALLLNCRRAGRPFLTMKYQSDDIIVDQPGRWGGIVYHLNGNTTAEIGDVLVHQDGNVCRSSGAPDEAVAGVCMAISQEDYGIAIVANTGQVLVNIDARTANNVILRAAAGGKASIAGHGCRIGWAYPADDNQARLRLSGLA